MARLHQNPMSSLNQGFTGEPEVIILEQPAPRNLRFRYECEGRLAGCITGVHSTPEKKTFPTIQVKNYRGPAVVVVSCVSKDPPFYPHPNNLVGKEGCKSNGICNLEIKAPDMIQSFTSLGIQCVKKKNVEESLRQREALKIDPFRTGFDHKSQPNSIDLNVVRLCFQVILMTADKSKKCPLPPIVSDPIYDKKVHSDLSIHKLSHYCAPVSGGTEVILLCEKVNKDVQIKFFEKRDGQEVWSANAEFQPNDIHKQVAISFRTPRYYDQDVSQEVNVWIQLVRSSDNTAGKPRRFQFKPLDRDPEHLAHKRRKFEEGCYDNYIRDLTGLDATRNQAEGFRVPRQVQYRGQRFNRAKQEASQIPCDKEYKITSLDMPSSSTVKTSFIGDSTNVEDYKKLNAASSHIPSTIHPMVNSVPVSTSVPYTDSGNVLCVDYQKYYSPNQMKHPVETVTPVSTSIPYTGGTLFRSLFTPSNTLEQEFATVPHGEILSSIPPPPLCDNSNSSPTPPPAAVGTNRDHLVNLPESIPVGNVLRNDHDLCNTELQISVEDAAEKFDSMSLKSFSDNNWFNINPTFDPSFDHSQNLDQNMTSEDRYEGGHTDENLRRFRKIERDLVELSQLCENTSRQSSGST